MSGNIQNQAELSLEEIDLQKLIRSHGPYFTSPSDWEDEVLYFLMLDRFSDGREYGGFSDAAGTPVTHRDGRRSTPPFDINIDSENVDRDEWFEAGRRWCGGTIAGLEDKLGYLRRMGVSAVWISPVFRQVTGSDDYHGYGIQNFLDVDPHFGTRDDLVRFVKSAHKIGIRVLLDIILNHAGDVFAYEGNYRYFYHDGRRWSVEGYRKNRQDFGSIRMPVTQAVSSDEAVWPREFQDEYVWSRQGEIRGWDNFPEYLDGDFLSLKDIDHGYAIKDPYVSWDLRKRIESFRPSEALGYLADVYKFWIAYADVDGYRIDTVKHMEPGAVRVFANIIHEFAQSIGKENFYLIGEVTGGRAHAVSIVNATGIDAALGIDDIQEKLEMLAKGRCSPGHPGTERQEGYFDLFRNSLLDDKNTHQWYGRHVVTMLNDHDQAVRQRKFRFCGEDGADPRFLIPALALNLCGMGIPCIYYGTEQAFNGADRRTDDASYGDVFLRECMFGGRFGSFQSAGRHFFDESHPVYRFLSGLTSLRRDHIALRRGRQYLREVSASGNEGDFHYPQPVGGKLRWVVAWSRIFSGEECLCAINTDGDRPLSVWVTVDRSLHRPGSGMERLFSTGSGEDGPAAVVENRNGSSIRITVPPAGFVAYR